VQQERPPEDDSSIFYLFERINTEGTALTPQEIRQAIYQGGLVELLAQLNETESWRSVYGPKSPRLKDRELILRFFALYSGLESYERPMKEFLNRYFKASRDVDEGEAARLRDLFVATIDTVHGALGAKPFRPVNALNAAVFDSVMVGIAKRLEQGAISDLPALARAYDGLLNDSEFKDAYAKATSDKESVRKRLELATGAFASVE